MAAAKSLQFPYAQKAYSYDGAELQKAWGRLHKGAKQGALGSIAASKAVAVAATYLEEDDRRALRLLGDAGKRAEEATRKLPGHANAWSMQAFVLGRYAQRVSIGKALAEGIGGKVRNALDRALAGRLTYGADAAKSVEHFEQALKLNPGSAIAHMEYANGLLMLHGDAKKKQAVELYRKAAACKPADAMERLDVEQAKAELE